MSLNDYSRYGKAAARLADAIRSGRVSHAYIIEGDSNVDKEGFARAFLKALFCKERPAEGCDTCVTCRKIEDGNYEDLYRIEPMGKKGSTAVSIKAEPIRDLTRDLAMKPTGGERNVAVISGADMMTPAAQNILLKTLEEPPVGTVILLLSENSRNLLPTINSRCLHIRLAELSIDPDNEMMRFAGEILEMAGRKAFFFEICSRLDEKIKDRKSAESFLDAFEAVLGDLVRRGSDVMSREQLIYGVKRAETARETISRNIRPMLVIRKMILELEEYR